MTTYNRHPLNKRVLTTIARQRAAAWSVKGIDPRAQESLYALSTAARVTAQTLSTLARGWLTTFQYIGRTLARPDTRDNYTQAE